MNDSDWELVIQQQAAQQAKEDASTWGNLGQVWSQDDDHADLAADFLCREI